MGDYVDKETLKLSAQAPEADGDNVFDQLAAAVSRMFDRECQVPDGFFDAAPTNPTTKTFRTDGTEYLNIGPYIEGSITAFTVDGVDRFEDDSYYESNSFIIFDPDVQDAPRARLVASVTAKFGFSDVPADVIQACIEQGLFMWRRKDLAFSDLAGVTSGVVSAKFSPTFSAVASRYRGLYSRSSYFG